jgi:hypothetical protein
LGHGHGLNLILEEILLDRRRTTILAGTNGIFLGCMYDTQRAYLAIVVVLGEQRVRLRDYLRQGYQVSQGGKENHVAQAKLSCQTHPECRC